MPKIKETPKHRNRWSDADRQAFADGNRTRATTIPNKRALANKQACRKTHKSKEN